MTRETKFMGVIAGVLTAAVIAVVLLVLYLYFGSLDPTSILASAPAGIAAGTGATLGVYFSRRSRTDEREALILHQSGMYAWLFLFIALPIVAVYLINIPSLYGLTAALILYGIWIVAILLFSITALHRYRR